MNNGFSELNQPPDESYPKCLRLRSGQEFDAVFACNIVAVDRVLVVHARSTALSSMRLGLSISKRTGNAPLRNKWKRLIREAFRRQRSNFTGGMDIVVRPRKGSQPEYSSVANSLRKLVERLQKQLHQPNMVKHE